MVPLLDVKMVETRPRLRFRKPGSPYKVVLHNGHEIFFSEEEKKAYEAELRHHADVLKVWGMCKSLGLRA